MSNGIIGRLLSGALWRSALTAFQAQTRDGTLDPPVPNLPLETPADGLARGLASATGVGGAAAAGTLAGAIPAAAFVSRAQLRARKKVRPARAGSGGQAAAVAAGYFLSSGAAQAVGGGTAAAASGLLSWGKANAASIGTAAAAGTNTTPAARPTAQGWIIF
jgi:hypothetical protein